MGSVSKASSPAPTPPPATGRTIKDQGLFPLPHSHIEHHYTQTSIMKFVALALTILLAAGSQARFLQADAPAAPPTQVEQVRAAVGMYLKQAKETALKTLEHLDDTEYKDYKLRLSQSLDTMQTYVQSASAALSPYTDAFASQFMEGTKKMREQIKADVEQLKKDLEPKHAELKKVVDEHLEEYRVKLEPLVKEYVEDYKKRMDELKAKMEPVLIELRLKLKDNVEETKTKLAPIVEAITAKLTERLNELKALAAPYVDEYKEQLKLALTEVQDKASQTDLQSKLTPYAEDMKAKIMAMWESLSKPETA
ncbi:hypothetical protein SKAU_G00090710 [Synaphobranchus kaupii]|uniref:Apolipoprotein A-I n=1 Tax=Synaphobranchus kaupii TaxID=118154 RepID=A0A9Q1FXG0_SYNKA|nr:hypothetical protein SKAU_G00090710 [Synaphobranchus kaupii]